ncbi:F0F1 ATP synthase subunit A [Flavobacterium sp. NRK F10]|uniref:F0F1 ATP synthase subunit A n=1 Tax=Flavobacterium sp. NRK F10 TaxID=2954931 RepID=UPI0020909666|nr:F0F1 ATP synthase subunit A [Flavobacterium sp. NRK F10]MCO6174932.1 F0F1 ATP synthase subunit A [Flavobacterium sp. NRK F10]
MVILKKPLSILAALMLVFTTTNVLASDTVDSTKVETNEVHADHVDHGETHGEEAKSSKDIVNEHIEHHLKDDYYFIFFSDEEEGKHYGFGLPVILLDNGLKVFSASEFHHGEKVVEKGGQFYKLYHSKVYKTDAEGTIQYDEHHHPTNERPLDFSITKNVFSLFLTAVLLFVMFTSLAKTYKTSHNNLPKGFNRVLEPLVIYVRDEIARPNIGEKKYKKFMPYLLTVFFLIWLLNLIGLTPLGINVTGNITVTLCLALFTFLITQFSANKDYWGHIFWMPGVPVPMKIVLMPIEVLGMFTKPFSLMIRLFANITAGHTVVMGLIAIVFLMKEQLSTGGAIGTSMALTLFISIIELLVAFLQAFIFTMLSSLFIGMAVQDHHHDEHHSVDELGDHDNAIV